MLNRRGIVNRPSLIRVSSSYQRMSPNGMDRRNFIGGLAMVSLTATAAGSTSRPFYPEEVRDDLRSNRSQMEAIDGQSKREVGRSARAARWCVRDVSREV